MRSRFIICDTSAWGLHSRRTANSLIRGSTGNSHLISVSIGSTDLLPENACGSNKPAESACDCDHINRSSNFIAGRAFSNGFTARITVVTAGRCGSNGVV